jgi:hypothetical protein
VSAVRKENHAFASNHIDPDRRGRPVVVGESVYSHGRKHQVDLERGGSNFRGVVAPECVWTISFSCAHPCWVMRRESRYRTRLGTQV